MIHLVRSQSPRTQQGRRFNLSPLIKNQTLLCPKVEEPSLKERPFSSLRLFESIKIAIAAMTTNQQLFGQSLVIIRQSAEFIKANTYVVVVFDVAKLNELLLTMDEVICKNLAKLDDGCDHMRFQFSLALGE